MKLYDSIGPNPRIVRMFMAEKGIEMPKQAVDLRKGENREAEHLKRNNRTDDYVRVAERISTLEPNNLQLARELAETDGTVLTTPGRPADPEAFRNTYGNDALIVRASNNYGPRQHPEKLIPLVIHNALAGKPLPIYGDGQQIRDWLYVKDHCSAIRRVLEAGKLGETYNVGGWNEKPNLDVVHTLCSILDELRPRADGKPYKEQITYVTDRPGHDRRYAIDARKIERELGWRPAETFATGIRKTVQWYLDNADWVADVQSGGYRDWVNKQYGGA